MIASEQLVDGMNLDLAWCTRNLTATDADVLMLVRRLIRDKALRMDEFSGNKITCFVKDEAEAERLWGIPGSGGSCNLSYMAKR